ncbi:MAG: hypothetical protein AAGI51_13435, partial [Pseudomonadota bacterium]
MADPARRSTTDAGPDAEAPAQPRGAAAQTPASIAEALAERLRARDRRALARAITLVESTRADHRAAADALVARLIAAPGGAPEAMRLGLSGTPGVGKSTFIESFGMRLA